MSLKITPNQRKIFEKLVLINTSNLIDLLRWDILVRQFVKFLCPKMRFMNSDIKNKSVTDDVTFNSKKFKASNRKENKKLCK